ASTAGLLGRLGRDVDFFKAHAVAGEQFDQPLVDALDVGQGKITASDPGLVRYDEQFEAGVLQSLQRFRRARKERDLDRIARVILLLDDGSIPVQEHGTLHKTPEFKLQAPRKFQIPSPNDILPGCVVVRKNRASFEAWRFDLLWCLELGVWSFTFGCFTFRV